MPRGFLFAHEVILPVLHIYIPFDDASTEAIQNYLDISIFLLSVWHSEETSA